MEKIGTTVRKTLGVLALVAMIPFSGWAFGGPGGGGGFQGPPQAAFDACAGKKAGDAVQFTTPRGDNVTAVCSDFDGKLAAAAGRGPGSGDRGPCWEGKGRHKGGRGMGMGAGRHLDRMAKELGLTAEQKGQIKNILDAERDKSAPLHKQLLDDREQLRKVVTKTPFDEAAVRKLMAEREKTRVELAVSRARAMNQAYALLTPGQKEKADKIGPFGMERGMGHGMGMGQGRPDCPCGR
jgi:Spy/CpxP family protein refolding chaperone